MSIRSKPLPGENELRQDLEGSVHLASRGDLSRLTPARRFRLEKADYVASEAAELADGDGPKHAIERVRNSISRGRLDDAERELSQWLVDPTDSLLRAEALLESARVRFGRGDWEGVVRFANEGLGSDFLPSVSRLTLHQLRAIAHLEAGSLSACSIDIELARALVELYPHSPSRFYLEATEAALEIERDRFDSARAKIRSLHGDRAEPNLDRFLTLLRLESRLARRLGHAFEPAALAAVQAARRMGDSLYEGLAWAELEASVDSRIRAAAASVAAEFGARFERVEGLRARRTEFPSVRAEGIDPVRLRIEDEFDRIVLLGAGWIVEWEKRNPVRIRRLELSSQQNALLRALANGPLPIDRFFEQVWGIRFHPHRHLSTVKVALKRVRDGLGIEARMRAGEVLIPQGTLVVDSTAFSDR